MERSPICLAVFVVFCLIARAKVADAQFGTFGSNSQAPSFALSSYVFNLTTCSNGLFIATITAMNPSGGSLAYSVDPGFGKPNKVAINYQTGQLNFADTPGSKIKFNVRATNFFGAAVVPVTVRCGVSSTGGIDVVCFNNYCTNTSTNNDDGYDFKVGDCTAGTYVGTVSNSGSTGYVLTVNGNSQSNSFLNPNSGIGTFNVNSQTGVITLAGNAQVGLYTLNILAYTNTGTSTTLTATVKLLCDGSADDDEDYKLNLKMICFDGNCYSTGKGTFSSSNVVNYTGFTAGSTATSTGGGTFAGGYSFTTGSCSSGSSVGTVSSANATNYAITSGSGGFAITSGGVITMTTSLTAGTYTFVVTATGGGTSVTGTVRAAVTCNYYGTGSGSSTQQFTLNSTCLFGNCLFNYTAPVFLQSPYNFAQTSCLSGVTIGTVSATDATGYYIVETGPWSNYYEIDRSSGVITSVYPVPGGYPVYLTITATNINGVPANDVVVISTTGCITTTTSSSSTATSTSISTFSPYFALASYTLTQTVGAVGTIGTVAATNACSYVISSGNNGGFAVSSSGVITATTAQSTGTYNLIETACSCLGVCVSVPVTIVVGSTTVTTTTTAASTSGTPVFTQPAGYTMAATSCTSGTAIGTVSATNAITYNLDNGLPAGFSVDSSGNITLTSAVAAGTYTLQVRAFSASGATTVVPVTVTVACSG